MQFCQCFSFFWLIFIFYVQQWCIIQYKFMEVSFQMENLFKREFLASDPVATIQIIHGMREHSGRYLDFANFLKDHGYSVFLSDHPFHGNSTERGLSIDLEEKFFTLSLDEQLAYSSDIKERFPNLPLFVLGHSMGSFILQKYMELPNPASGFILSGSCGKRKIIKLGYLLLTLYLKFFKDSYSPKFEELMFWGFNKKEKNDWLTRDREIYSSVEKDPLWKLCYPISFYRQFFKLLIDIYLKNSLAAIDRDKPIYIFSGDRDPVGLNGRGVYNLFKQYRNLGCKNIKLKIYPEGHHEMLSEINKFEVYEDIIRWLNSSLKSNQ